MEDNRLAKYLETNADRQLGELVDWLRIPSVSTLAEHRGDMISAASWLARYLASSGLGNVRIIETAGHPLVYADWLGAGDQRPTVLIYGHYDVQPVDPLDQWISPPFEPTIRGDNLYARGAADDKGQFLALIAAVQALLAVRGELPVNIKLLGEGEEEIGGQGISAFLQENHAAMAADVCLIADTPIVSPERPSVAYGLRGVWAGEICMRGPARDLHSGGYGGVVHNPIQALAEVIASLHDRDGRVAVPGFYDDVVDLDPGERERLAQVPYGEAEFLAKTGAPTLHGEPGYSPVELIGVRPTLEINGMWGGFNGAGIKTVIPAVAHAKISCRLVPNQDPQRIQNLVFEYLKKIAPETVTMDLSSSFGVGAVLIDPESPSIRAAGRAYEYAFGAPPLLTREGGGIPVVTEFLELLGVEVVLMGFGLPDDHAHAPNERIHIPNFHRGIRTACRFMDELGGAGFTSS